MGTSARVTSVDAVSRFRQTLANFTEQISGALFSLRSEVLRTQEWIEHECPQYWRVQSRLAFDSIAAARSSLETAKMRGKVAGHHPSCYDEQLALRKAKQRLQFANDQIEVARRWGNKFRHEAEEYKGILGKLQQLLDHDLVMLQATLDGMIRSLEAYLAGMPVESSAPEIDRDEVMRMPVTASPVERTIANSKSLVSNSSAESNVSIDIETSRSAESDVRLPESTNASSDGSN